MRLQRLFIFGLLLGACGFGSVPASAVSGTPPSRDSVPYSASSNAPRSSNPFESTRWYIDPNSAAKRQIQAWKKDHPDWAEALKKIADQPQADWFTEETAAVGDAVNRRVTKITRAHALPVLVAYYIPHRDCGSYSGGGAREAGDYRNWIHEFAKGLGNRRAVVILEPDALDDVDTAGCLSTTEKQTRLDLLSEAVTALKTSPATTVYIDAGNARWVSAARIADLLHSAGIAEADGFALNVSNFVTTEETMRFGLKIASLVGGKHFVIDTSRNGQGPADHDEWCNPPDRGLGTPPTTHTAASLCDAYLWIKSPGESDGEGAECHDGPVAGKWWPEYALHLAQRSKEVSSQPSVAGSQ